MQSKQGDLHSGESVGVRAFIVPLAVKSLIVRSKITRREGRQEGVYREVLNNGNRERKSGSVDSAECC